MKELRLLLFLAAAGLLADPAMAQQNRLVDFVGAARSVISNDGMDVSDSIPDTTSILNTSGGYALIDLGVDIQPNASTEILGMFRIRNQYGGFWGAGVTFDVRQLWLKGVIGDIVRYQVGDLNLQQTPFTLYNHHADRWDSLPSVFSLQSDIVDYERFYTGNTWRQQGVNIDFGLEFSKLVREINFTGYVTRMNATDFTSIPDRLLAGFSATVVQQQGLDIGYHRTSLFNVQGTAATGGAFSNDVHSATLLVKKTIGAVALHWSSEAGESRLEDEAYPDQSPLSDYFLYSRLALSWEPRHLSFYMGYLNVGPDFRSPGAQNKEIDYTSLSGYFDRYTNSRVLRPLSITDYLQDENIYRPSIQSDLMSVNPSINNISPYGLSTFNRLGGYIGLNYSSAKGVSINLQQDRLREIRGQGTLALKEFVRTKGSLSVDLHRLIDIKRNIVLRAGIDDQITSRTSQSTLEDIDLHAVRYFAGMELELVRRFDLMAGWMSLRADGNEFLPERDGPSDIGYFESVSYDLNESSWATGLRFRFDPKIYLSALYQKTIYEERSGASVGYSLDRFALIYSMTF
ncbi:MAG: hypothetical protein RL021_1151 [Bacteroidota bacterium]|jgi:hypothetical protein